MKNLLIASLLLVATGQVLAEGPAHAVKTTHSRQAAKAKSAPAAAPVANQLSPEELRVAEQIQLGRLPCELGNFVQIDADPKSHGYFNVQVKGYKYHMAPVVTSTGAIRLEDRKAGAVWLQLANKSMLMNQKLGQRLADECMSPSQMAVADALARNPGQGVLDTPTAASASSQQNAAK